MEDELFYYHTPAPGPIRPVGNLGDYVVVYGSVLGYNVYRIASRAPLHAEPQMVINGGPLGVGANKLNQQTDAVLNMTQGTLAQLRFKVLDPMLVEFFQPGSTPGRNTAGFDTRLTPTGGGDGDYLTEMYLSDNSHGINLNLMSMGFRALPQSRVGVYGFRYSLWGAAAPAQQPDDPMPSQLKGGTINPLFQSDNINTLAEWLRRQNIHNAVPLLMAYWGS